MKKTIIALAAFGLMYSCGPSEEKLDYEPTEYDKIALDFAAEKGWETKRLESGVHVYIEKEGESEKPSLTDLVIIHYKGYLMDGTMFDGTQDHPAEFPLNQLIPGWKKGIPEFGRGGKGVLIIPPDLAYGKAGAGPIPPNSVLYFEIELLDFKKPAPPEPMKDYTPEIEAYIQEKGWDAKPTGSGLYVLIEEPGNDEKPQISQSVTMFYKGYLLDGTVFDGTSEKPVTFPLSNLISGWKEGIPLFGKGGKGKLVIPPHLGYGSKPPPSIPPNSILIFDIELVDFEGDVMDQ